MSQSDVRERKILGFFIGKTSEVLEGVNGEVKAGILGTIWIFYISKMERLFVY
jgi:hypothetical protein